MNLRIRQAIILIIISAVAAILVNSISPAGIALRGNWPSMTGSDTVVVPPSAQPGDPPFVSLDEAAARFQSDNVIFFDARDTADYRLSHIRGAINVPYDYYEPFWPIAEEALKPGREVVIYCSGDECELSLLLGRVLQQKGYSGIYIFYGGWREWEKARLPIEKGI